MPNRLLSALRSGAVAALLAILPTTAGAVTCPVVQSTPQFTAGGNVFGRIAAQWNSYFGAKVDANNGVLCNPTIIPPITANLKCTDLSDGGTACPADTGTSGHTLPFLDTPNAWGAPQRGKQGSVTISVSTFTLDLNVNQNFSITLVHASCPCTIANPSNIASAPGQVGMLKIIQSATGSDTIGSWGGNWKFAGGTAPTLSTTANAIDQFSYYVDDSTHIVLSSGLLDVK